MIRPTKEQEDALLSTVPSSSSRNEPAEADYSSSGSDDDSDINLEDEDTNDNDADAKLINGGGGMLSQGNVRSEMDVQLQLTKAKNREHAKNTRMRKKNYIEMLKDDIKQISNARDVRERERKSALSKMADQVSPAFLRPISIYLTHFDIFPHRYPPERRFYPRGLSIERTWK